MSREIPIIFNGDMVRAILSGQKTQTRRPVKSDFIQSDRAPLEVAPGIFHFWCSGVHACPYGRPGGLLWVRETHAIVPRTAYRCSVGVQQTLRPDDDHDAAIYRADWTRSQGGLRWRPSIHMPRWASRILLRVTAVRVERVQDISEKDAWAEGCEGWDDDVTGGSSGFGEFAGLWEAIYGNWGTNPWVWVIEFERVTDSKQEAA